MSHSTEANSASEDLAYIRHIMEDTRRTVAERGESFIIWSVVVLIGLLGTWLLPRYYPGWSVGILWAGLVSSGWLVTWLFMRRGHGNAPSPTRSPAGRLCAALWFACTLAMMIIFFAGIPTGVIQPSATLGIVCAVVGIGVLINGALMGLGWFRNLAFGWWAGAVVEFIWHGLIGLIIMACLVVLLYLIPGLILNAQVRRAGTAARQ